MQSPNALRNDAYVAMDVAVDGAVLNAVRGAVTRAVGGAVDDAVRGAVGRTVHGAVGSAVFNHMEDYHEND